MIKWIYICDSCGLEERRFSDSLDLLRHSWVTVHRSGSITLDLHLCPGCAEPIIERSAMMRGGGRDNEPNAGA
ncbi:MAG: hypothetical protein ACE5HA_03340 [Anaerolineae bacterium]